MGKECVKLFVDRVWKINLYHVYIEYTKMAWSKYLVLFPCLDVLIFSLILRQVDLGWKILQLSLNNITIDMSIEVKIDLYDVSNTKNTSDLSIICTK